MKELTNASDVVTGADFLRVHFDMLTMHESKNCDNVLRDLSKLIKECINAENLRSRIEDFTAILQSYHLFYCPLELVEVLRLVDPNETLKGDKLKELVKKVFDIDHAAVIDTAEKLIPMLYEPTYKLTIAELGNRIDSAFWKTVECEATC